MFTARYLYLFGRAGATFASLALALGYSRDLGVVNRSSISIIMTTNALLWIVLTSGTTLTIRKIGWLNAEKSLVRSFNSVITAQFIIIIGVYFLVLNLYSQIKNPIALNLMLLSLCYVVASGIHLILMELLLSTGRFRSAGLLEILTVLSQLTLYVIGSQTSQISVASRLLLAFTISYLIISALALYLISITKEYPIGLGSPSEFIKRSRYNHILGASLGFMDRVDRLLVGFLLATPVLGKYAVATTLITLLRFFPDGVSKLIMAKRVTLQRFDRIRKELVLVTGMLLAGFVVFIAREVIEFWLGPQWLLGLSIYIAIAMQELSRGVYQIVANQKILGDSSRTVHRAATLTPIFAVSAAFLGAGIFGLAAVPSAFCLSYLIGILIMRRNLVT
jgi:O-antigen/teichoic acid export membrane protein